MRRRRTGSAGRLGIRLRNPPAHWGALGFCMLVVLAVILFEGYATHGIGAPGESSPTSAASAGLEGTGPVFQAVDGKLQPIGSPAGKRIALTFDDGPDPTWTPRIADILKREGVRATFFVTGSAAARHPDIIRRLRRDGNEIGNHTFTHAALDRAGVAERLQLSMSEAIMVGITGHYSRLLRPPYSATPDALTEPGAEALSKLVADRYLIVLSNFDSNDWRRPGVAAIVKNAMPPGTKGGAILMHDGGGDRAQTVAALERLIPALRARGFTFATASELAGVPAELAEPAASRLERLRGDAFELAIRLGFLLATVLGWTLVAIVVLVVARALVVFAFARHHVRVTRSVAATDLHDAAVVVIVPAYNESVGIARAVTTLASSDYPNFRVIVVDDGSTDGTADVVEALALPRVEVIRQANAGKAAAINTGIAASHEEIVVSVDGDTVFEKDTLRLLVQPFADPRVGAVSGNTKVGNRAGLLGRWQHIEYVTGFNLDRRMYDVLQCTPTVPGAIGAFRRDALTQVGGVSDATLAEDTDLTLAIGRTGRRVVYAEGARAWTEAPSTLGGLWRQRYRWSFGTMQAIWKHRGAMIGRRPGDRRIGHRALPYMIFFQIALPIAAPLIDLFAIYGLLFGNRWQLIGVWVAFNVIQLAIGAYAFRLDGESLRPLWAMPLQQFVYRQLMYLVVIESTISALIGARAHWRHIERTGDVQVEPPAA